jgi:hypothetical protein
VALGRPVALTCTVARFEPPRQGELAITGDQKGRVVTRCDEVESGTRLTQIVDFTMPGGMLGRLVGGMAESMLGRELDQSLHRIKVTLELERGGVDGSGSSG